MIVLRAARLKEGGAGRAGAIRAGDVLMFGAFFGSGASHSKTQQPAPSTFTVSENSCLWNM